MTPTMPRAAAVLTARQGVSGELFERTLREVVTGHLTARARARDAVLAGVALPADSDEERFGPIAPIDGFVEVTMSSSDELVDVFRGAAERLSDVVDPARSAVVAGEGHLVQSYSGKFVYAMVFRRAAGVREQDLTAWWTRHGEIPMAVLRGLDFGYEQLHGRDSLTTAVAEASGIADAGFGLFETMSTDDIDALAARFDQETAERALADEQGYLDRAGMRGQWCVITE